VNGQTSTPAGPAPLILTMGDPAGIGPEIVIKAACERPELLRQLVVAGDVATLRRALRALRGPAGSDASAPMLAVISDVAALDRVPPGCLAVIQACVPLEPVVLGCISAQAGRAAADCIRVAAQAVLSGQARAMVTAPIHKEAFGAAGLPFPGHTEFLQSLAAEYAGVALDQMPVRMMLSCPGLRTVLVSIHVALREAIAAVTQAQVLETLRITAAHFARCGMPEARIAVAGLNPHAGEGGLFGHEEVEIIAPAIAQAQHEGLHVVGPLAPDTVFMRARQGEFDVVVAMYHDQGLIPVKLLGLEHGVNTTLGLPLVRTSPDHGTAFDLAGTGRASASSLLAAIESAMAMTAAEARP
jgi:4-hydroxythreonine-4-phosphate dehydrogenase